MTTHQSPRRLSLTSTADTSTIPVRLTPNGPVLQLAAHPKFSALVSWLEKNQPPVADGEPARSHAELGDMATAIIEALRGTGIALSKGNEPALLLSVHRGANPTARMMSAMLAETPALQRTALDARVHVAADYLRAFAGRVL